MRDRQGKQVYIVSFPLLTHLTTLITWVMSSSLSRSAQVPPILLDKQFSDFTPDITPIILAAHTNNYEIIKLLVQKGVSVPQPHEVGHPSRHP